MTQKITYLNKLPINTLGKIKKLEAPLNIKRRLLDLGLIEGTTIVPVFKSPFGDPTAFYVRDSLIALRKDDINKIEVDMWKILKNQLNQNLLKQDHLI